MESKAKQQQGKIKRTEIGFWTMVRDVLVASINKGQLPQAVLGIVLITVVVKMPPKDVAELSREVLNRLYDLSLLGWIIALVSIICWSWHVKRQRRWWSREMERVSEERNKYQERTLQEKLGSSKK